MTAEVMKDPETSKGEKSAAKPKPLKTTLYQKILSVMDQVGGYMQKDGVNKEQKYTFLSEAAIATKVEPALVLAGIIALPKYTLLSSEDKNTTKGSTWKLATVSCQLKIIDVETGEFDDTVIALGQGLDSGDKAVAKAEAQAYKYAWSKTLCIGTGDDPEADTSVDQQQFVSQQQPELNVELAAKEPMMEIIKMWNFAGWDISRVQDYVLKRMNRTSFDGATPSEYITVINDLAAYMQSQGMKVTVIPF